MATKFKGKGGHVAKKILPPVTRGIVGWHILGESVDVSAYNHVRGGKAALVAGSPEFDGAGMTLSNKNRIDLPVGDSPDITLISVWDEQKSTGTDVCNVIGRQTATSPGILLFTLGSATRARSVSFNASHLVDDAAMATPVGLSAVDLTKPHFIAAVAGTTTKNKLYDFTSDRTAEHKGEHGQRAVESTKNLQIGGGAFTGSSTQYFAAVYHAALSESEIKKIYLWVKKHLLSRGVEI